MPRRDDIKKVMIIGSGPIVIGQACEFDYSGTQACKALRALGYEIVLANSNPATIMTDPGTADVTYLEPLTFESIREIIEKEQSLLDVMAQQVSLNTSNTSKEASTLAKALNVEIKPAASADIAKIKKLMGSAANRFKAAYSIINLGTQLRYDKRIKKSFNFALPSTDGCLFQIGR